MLGAAERAQQGFFDASWCGNVVPRESFDGLLAEHGERLLRDGDFADCYSERRGRPSIPPSILGKLLLLQCRSGLSDAQAMEAVRFDLRWKVALGLPLDREGFHPTRSSRFAPVCSCAARSASPSSARSPWPLSWACSRRRSSR